MDSRKDMCRIPLPLRRSGRSGQDGVHSYTVAIVGQVLSLGGSSEDREMSVDS